MREYGRNPKIPSRALRKEMTEAEKFLWSRIRRKQLLGVQFYRQKPVGPLLPPPDTLSHKPITFPNSFDIINLYIPPRSGNIAALP